MSKYIAKNTRSDPFELLKRAVKAGMTPADYYKFRILFARGYEPRVFASLNRSIALRELRETLKSNPFKDPPA